MRIIIFTFLLLAACALHDDRSAPQAYVSCRCCCPEGGRDLPVICLYHAQGDSMADIIRKDDEWGKAAANACKPGAGCTQATLYKYCDEIPPALE